MRREASNSLRNRRNRTLVRSSRACSNLSRAAVERTTCRGEERAALEAVLVGLEAGVPARAVGLTPAQQEEPGLKSMGLLTLKPVVYAFNLAEHSFCTEHAEALASARRTAGALPHSDPSADCVAVCSAQLEASISELDGAEEQRAYLEAIGVEPAGGRYDGLLCHHMLPSLVRQLLKLSLCYTGPGVRKEATQTTKAHLFHAGSLSAAALAGRVHGDLERGFIRAEVVPAPTLLSHASCAAAREAGSMRTEGREYPLADEDVVLIKWKRK